MLLPAAHGVRSRPQQARGGWGPRRGACLVAQVVGGVRHELRPRLPDLVHVVGALGQPLAAAAAGGALAALPLVHADDVGYRLALPAPPAAQSLPSPVTPSPAALPALAFPPHN